MKLTEGIQKALHYIQHIEVENQASAWDTGRAFYEKFTALSGPEEPVYQIEDKIIPGKEQAIKLRIYRPNDAEELPALLYFHGGWFNAGSLETHDKPLRQLSNCAQAIIISVDYRLAPENPFPAGLEDAEAAVTYILANSKALGINPERISLAGDSAGAALVATLTRKFSANIASQLLIYPVTDNSLNTTSWDMFKEGPLITLESGIQAWNWYLPNQADHNNVDAIPLLAEDLDSLPPSFIAVAQYDPLRDEALHYADKLESKGVKVERKVYLGMTHGFFHMGGFVPETATLTQDLANFIHQHKRENTKKEA